MTFENWFGKILCTHNVFRHRFVLISSVLSYSLLSISILKNIIFSVEKLKKKKGNLIPQPEVPNFLMVIHTFYK